MARSTSRSVYLLLAALLCLSAFQALSVTPAHASRALLSQALLHTSPGSPSAPPPEGQIEGACGLAISPGGKLYVSDYYHRVVDIFSTTGNYESQLVLPGRNPVFGTNTLDAVCGLAFDSAGGLFADELHEAALRLAPAEATIETGNSTGVAVDPATDDLYVDQRTSISRYASPVIPGAAPAESIALPAGVDAYGIAAFAGRIYVADAASGTVFVYELATDPSKPVATIAGFHSLVNAALAVDPTNGHLLVLDNLQPGFEHPIGGVKEFAADGTYLGQLSGAPVDGEPSGLAVDPSSGNLYVTDGNDELANVFKYGPYGSSSLAIESSTSAPLVETGAAVSKSSVALPELATEQRPTTATPRVRHKRHGRHRRHKGQAKVRRSVR